MSIYYSVRDAKEFLEKAVKEKALTEKLDITNEIDRWLMNYADQLASHLCGYHLALKPFLIHGRFTSAGIETYTDYVKSLLPPGIKVLSVKHTRFRRGVYCKLCYDHVAARQEEAKQNPPTGGSREQKIPPSDNT